MTEKRGRMAAGQRVVKSVPDRSGKGNAYTKTSNGGKQRISAAVKYMDKHEHTQLYTVDERGEFRETDRHEAAGRIEDTETKYQQHMVFTTELRAEETHVDKEEYARMVAESVQRVKPDAQIYAVSVHTQNENGEDKIHAHVAFGTDTTIQKSQLPQFREEAYQHEKAIIERGRDRELTPEEERTADRMRDSRTEQERHEQRQQSRGTRDEDRER